MTAARAFHAPAQCPCMHDFMCAGGGRPAAARGTARRPAQWRRGAGVLGQPLPHPLGAARHSGAWCGFMGLPIGTRGAAVGSQLCADCKLPPCLHLPSWMYPIALHQSTPAPLPPCSSPQIRCLDLSADRAQLAVVDDANKLAVYSLATQVSQAVVAGPLCTMALRLSTIPGAPCFASQTMQHHSNKHKPCAAACAGGDL